jgi:hypothetical protein
MDNSEWNFDYSKERFDCFLYQLYWMNEIIEGKRNVEGHDDEPEDEFQY